jgi:DNA end-binding protein Ku
MARPIARGILSFGLVAIPVEIHTATKSENVSFHLLHGKCGSRVRNQVFCPICKVVVKRSDLVRGYEVAKGEYVQLTDEELESLEAEANSAIELKEFIPIEKIDPVYFEHGYYLAPEPGGEKPYRLLADAMNETGKVALAEMVSHNKENLVLIRPAKFGLVLQVMFYANEVRDFGAIPKGEGVWPTRGELELARSLVEKLSSPEFEPERYSDLYRTQVLAMLEEKVKGGTITVPPHAPPRGNVVDLYETLKRSLQQADPEKSKQRARARRKA